MKCKLIISEIDRGYLIMKSYEYYPSLCASCHQGPGSPSTPLLRCSKCKIFYYCSRVCQSKDWKQGHKRLCSVIANSSEGRSHFFSGHSGQTAPQWREDCLANIEQFSDFSQWSSVFIFPPVCRQVGCFSPGEGGQGGLLTCLLVLQKTQRRGSCSSSTVLLGAQTFKIQKFTEK